MRLAAFAVAGRRRGAAQKSGRIGKEAHGGGQGEYKRNTAPRPKGKYAEGSDDAAHKQILFLTA